MQRRDSGCDENGENNGHLTTLKRRTQTTKQTKRKTINKFNAGGEVIHLVIEIANIQTPRNLGVTKI